jgi:hypothetical protein
MIRYLKAAPTSYVLQFKNGKVKRQGAGLSFFYWEPTTTLVQVPLASADVPFCFTELTADFQAVTVQGQLTYRVADPQKLAGLLDFTVTAQGAWCSEDPGKLYERLVNQAQLLTRASTEQWTLKEALTRGEALSRTALAGLRASDAVAMLGLEVLALSILSVRPTPEMGRALEAEAREALQRKSDEAIYERRNAVVEQERRIKRSELETEVMTEQQRRLIRETTMAADIALEQERQQLIEQKVENDKKAADAQAYALAATLLPLRTLDWKVLTALSQGAGDPGAMIAVAFRELAENAQKIGELNVSPDLLRALLPATAKGK